MKRDVRFEVFKGTGDDHQYYIRFRGVNGETMTSEGYKKKSQAHRVVDFVRKNAARAKCVELDAAGNVGECARPPVVKEEPVPC